MPYDAQMIRDFVTHLLWSLRVDHFELTAGPGALNPELKEQVERLGRQSGVPRLLSLFSLERDSPALTNEQMREAMRHFREHMAGTREEQLRHLEALKQVLDESLAHAEGRVFDIKLPGSKVLDGSWFRGSASDPS
jgi:hypothetical protein